MDEGPFEGYRKAIWLALLAVTLWSTTGCESPPDASRPAKKAGLEVISPPEDLPQLDVAVREQFQALWQALESSRDSEVKARADAWGALGRWFDVYHYAESAVLCYRNAHRLAPDEPRWPYHLGVLAAASGDFEDAEKYLTNAVSSAPDEPTPKVRLGDLALEQGDLYRAEKLYASVLEELPQNPGGLLGIGRVALARGDGRGAIEPLSRLVKLQPEATQARYSLALALRAVGDTARADEHLAAVPADNLDQITLDLGSPWDLELNRFDRGARTLTRRGIRAFRRGEHGQAAVLLGAAVAAEPEGAEKRVNYALALRRTGHLRQAREELQAAIRLAEPGSEMLFKAHFEMGRLLSSQQTRAAIEHLNIALELDRRSVPARLELGRIYQLLDRPEDALSQYAAVRDGEQPRPEVSFWHAAMLTALGRYADAIRALEEDSNRLGDARAPALLLARLLSAAPDERLRDVQRARRLLPGSTRGETTGDQADANVSEETVAEATDVLFAETAAMVAAAEGNFDRAITWQRAAVSALGAGGPRSRAAAHIARRRQALYESRQAFPAPWVVDERLVRLPVVPPSAQAPSEVTP